MGGLNLIKRALYRSCQLGIRAYQRLFMRYRVWGREHVSGDPKLFVANHVSALFQPPSDTPLLIAVLVVTRYTLTSRSEGRVS